MKNEGSDSFLLLFATSAVVQHVIHVCFIFVSSVVSGNRENDNISSKAKQTKGGVLRPSSA
jgi:hypothetical protein